MKHSGQRIKYKDIGRCYYYKSITEYVLGGDEAAKQADEDKLTTIKCYIVSETVTLEKKVLKELMELEIRTIKRLMREESRDDEWEDEG